MNEVKSGSRGAMTAQQFWGDYFGTGKEYADKQMCEFADALSAHNTAQLTKEVLRLNSERGQTIEKVAIALGRPGLSNVFDDDIIRGVAELRAALEAKEKELAKIQPAMRALEGLTPSGSEFVGDVKRCVQFVRDAQESQHRVIVNFSKRAKEAEAELSRLRSQGAGQWEAGRDAAADFVFSRRSGVKVSGWEIRALQPPEGLAEGKRAPVEGAGQSAHDKAERIVNQLEVDEPLGSEARTYEIKWIAEIIGEGAGQWISVEERLPILGSYLIWHRSGYIDLWHFNPLDEGNVEHWKRNAKHWQILPSAPGLASPPEGQP